MSKLIDLKIEEQIQGLLKYYHAGDEYQDCAARTWNHEIHEPEFNWDKCDCQLSEQVKEIVKLFQQTLSQVERETEERIHQAFIRNYRGVGELWIPYESEGNCTKEEELEAVEREWQDVIDELKGEVNE